MTQALRIVIDAGHGGSERAGNSSAYGARGPRGVVEKDVTLDIAKHVVARLGGAAALTRSGDRNLTIGARAAHGQRSDIFVSIHANYGAPELSGPEVYVHPEAGRGSRSLAARIAHALDRQAGRYGGGADERRAAMAVLNPNAIGQTAACLVEVDYLSNPRGEQRLGDPGERAAIGAAIASAIQQHLSSGYQGGYGQNLRCDNLLQPGRDFVVHGGAASCLEVQPAPGHRTLSFTATATMTPTTPHAFRRLYVRLVDQHGEQVWPRGNETHPIVVRLAPTPINLSIPLPRAPGSHYRLRFDLESSGPEDGVRIAESRVVTAEADTGSSDVAIGRAYGLQLDPSSSRPVDSGSLTLQPGIPGHAPLLLSNAHNGGTLALEGTIVWSGGGRPRAITARFTDLASQGIAGTDHAIRLPADLDVAIPITGVGNESLRWPVPINPGPARIELMIDSTDPETRARIEWRVLVSPPSLVPPSPITEGLQDNIRWDVLEQRLRYGCVVDLDVRINDSREPMSHAYPIDTAGKVKLPMVGLVDALDISLQTLAQRVQALLTPDYYRSPTVNATLKRRIVSYGANVTEPRLHVRLLDSSGAIQNDSGWYPVRADGTLNLPYVGSVMARGRRLDEVEAEVQAGYRRDYLINAIVHVTPFELDAG